MEVRSGKSLSTPTFVENGFENFFAFKPESVKLVTFSRNSKFLCMSFREGCSQFKVLPSNLSISEKVRSGKSFFSSSFLWEVDFKSQIRLSQVICKTSTFFQKVGISLFWDACLIKAELYGSLLKISLIILDGDESQHFEGPRPSNFGAFLFWDQQILLVSFLARIMAQNQVFETM